jgi:hypothetical protein
MGYIGKTPTYVSSSKGSDIASATTITIDGSSGYFDVTGTTTITGMTVDADRAFSLQFDGVLTLTHGSSLVLPNDANITTAAGDIVTFQSVGADSVIAISVTKADGTAVVQAGASAFFSASLTAEASNQTGNGATYTPTFGTTIFDDDSVHSGTTFTAPSTGKYLLLFHIGILSVTSAADNQTWKIVTSNRTYQARTDNTNNLNPVHHYTLSVIADMDASDTATCQLIIGGEASDVVDIRSSSNETSFQGCLLGT